MNTETTIKQNEILDISQNLIDRHLTSILLKLGIPTKIKGFFFAKEAAKIAFYNPMARFNINEQIFNVLGRKYSIAPSTIERSIRHLLTKTADGKKMNNFETLFNIKNNFSLLHPSVGEFISLLAESINFTFNVKL